MNVGDTTIRGTEVVLVVREMTFKEYCDKHDDLMLEYDIDDAWKAWKEMGPCFEGLYPDGKLAVLWPE